MKNYLIFFSLFCLFAMAKAADSPQAVFTQNVSEPNSDEAYAEFLQMVEIIKSETTKREWQLFCDMTGYAFSEQYSFLHEDQTVSLTWDEAVLCAGWLIRQEKESGYLTQVLQEIDECPAPTADQVANLCRTVRFYERDEAPDSIGYTYHRSLWSMACAVPQVDSKEVGREKVRQMWNKHKKTIRCEVGGGSRSEDLNITKYAIDSGNHRFTSELVIAYKLDFNFIDKKDGMTLLDFVQDRIELEKRYTPPAENRIKDYENLYNAIVKNGGKHAKDLTPEELAE